MTIPGRNDVPKEPPRVLIFDNDRKVIMELKECIKAEGYHVVCVEQTNELFEYVIDDQIDVLVLAVETWDSKGYELLPILKKLKSNLPIIVTSADDSMEVATKVREQGVFFYAIKPLDIEEVKIALRSAIGV